MAAINSDHSGCEKGDAPSASRFIPMFDFFREEIDQHHDRRERIIKASRDITTLSKKIIFSLQRVRTLNQAIPPEIAAETRDRLSAIMKLFVSISPDLQGLNFWRYQRQISPGFQEFIEAVSFEHYLQTQSLITHEEAAKLLPSKIDLTDDDYILGLFDLTGELMRFAITAIATSGSPPGSEQVKTADEKAILVDLQQLKTSFESLATISKGSTGLGKEVEKKLEVMKTCVEKVEAAVYGKTIRGREGHNGWMPDILDHGVETY